LSLSLRRHSGGCRYAQQPQRYEVEPGPVRFHVAQERSTRATPARRAHGSWWRARPRHQTAAWSVVRRGHQSAADESPHAIHGNYVPRAAIARTKATAQGMPPGRPGRRRRQAGEGRARSVCDGPEPTSECSFVCRTRNGERKEAPPERLMTGRRARDFRAVAQSTGKRSGS